MTDNGTIKTLYSDKDKTQAIYPRTTASAVSTEDGSSLEVEIAGKQDSIKLSSVTLSTTWEGSGPYTQAVTIAGTTSKSKIDLQPDSTVLAQMSSDKCKALYISNNNGTLTCYAVGAPLTAEETIQVSITEVN